MEYVRRRYVYSINGVDYPGLNPYSNGICPKTSINETHHPSYVSVLILILMEYVRRQRIHQTRSAVQCGVLILILMEYVRRLASTRLWNLSLEVLILILMEYVRRPTPIQSSLKVNDVLILILMEYVRRQRAPAPKCEPTLVLILILMEYVRRLRYVRTTAPNYSRLNPYSNGICPKTRLGQPDTRQRYQS